MNVYFTYVIMVSTNMIPIGSSISIIFMASVHVYIYNAIASVKRQNYVYNKCHRRSTNFHV